MQFDELEDCFNLSINVFEMDKDTLEINKIRESQKQFDIINILDYDGHAMYITNIDMVLSKYPCNKCGAIFETSKKLINHKKNKCEFETFDSFVKKPQLHRPRTNAIKEIIMKHNIKDVDHYLDHFIVYDFEAILMDIDEQRGDNSRYTSCHKAVSVSISDSLSNETSALLMRTLKHF